MPSRGTESIWVGDPDLPRFPTLDALTNIDVIVVGAGISGLTTALLLQRGGFTTAVLDQSHADGGESARTSAHLTVFPDAGYARLTADFGLDTARAIAQSKRDAIARIETFTNEIVCDFRRVPGYLFAEDEADRKRLGDEAAASRDAGLVVNELDAAPLPFPTAGAIEFPDQAEIHPIKYLGGLIRLYAEAGGVISDGTHVRGIDDEDGICRIRTDRSILHSKYAVAMTDAPITGSTMLDTKLRASRSYVVAFRVTDDNLPTGLFWDTAEPYHYIRSAMTSAGPIVLVGGEDHRVGLDGDGDAFEALERYARERFSIDAIARRWSGQIMEPVDGLPYIGPREENSHVFVATGYAGNGLTFATVAAEIIADAIGERVNPVAAVYAPERPMRARQWAKYAAQNLPAAWNLVAEILPHPHTASVDDLERGEGRLIRIDGQEVAAARDSAGVLHVLSPTCTHMGCAVAWNHVEQTWDCPCHGSRYDIDGTVLHGPATVPLSNLSAAAGAGPIRKIRSTPH